MLVIRYWICKTCASIIQRRRKRQRDTWIKPTRICVQPSPRPSCNIRFKHPIIQSRGDEQFKVFRLKKRYPGDQRKRCSFANYWTCIVQSRGDEQSKVFRLKKRYPQDQCKRCSFANGGTGHHAIRGQENTRCIYENLRCLQHHFFQPNRPISNKIATWKQIYYGNGWDREQYNFGGTINQLQRSRVNASILQVDDAIETIRNRPNKARPW